jgi:hypothetical protein
VRRVGIAFVTAGMLFLGALSALMVLTLFEAAADGGILVGRWIAVALAVSSLIWLGIIALRRLSK